MARNSIMLPSMLNLKIVYNLFINREGVTIRNLADNIKTDYKNTYNSVEELFKAGIIQKKKVGYYNICRLNYFNENIVQFLKEYNFYFRLTGFKKKYHTEYGVIIEAIQSYTSQAMMNPFFVCLVFGSYAKGEEKKDSDIDLLFLVLGPTGTFNIVLNKINAPYQKKFHIVEQDINDFIIDLENKNKVSLATELYKYPPIVFYGDGIFFNMMVMDRKQW